MEGLEQLRDRYVRLNRIRPSSKDYVQKNRVGYGRDLPAELLQTLKFFDGSGFALLPLHAIALQPDSNMPAETLRLRASITLSNQFLVLGSLRKVFCLTVKMKACFGAMPSTPLNSARNPSKGCPEKWED